MDLYGNDKKLSELTDGPLGDFLDSDVFTPPVSSSMDVGFGLDPGTGGSAMDSDWLDNFFDDPVLNDRMISDALQPSAPGQQATGGVQSEHSYSSLHNHDNHDDEGTLDLSKATSMGKEIKAELDVELTAVNPNNMTLTTAHTTIPTSSGLRLGTTSDLYIKQEPLDLSLDTEMTTVTVTRSTNPQTLLKQPTIILATSSQQPHTTATLRQERLVLPKVEIKMEQPQQSTSSHHHHHHHSHHLQQQQQQQQRYNSHSLMSSPEHSTESLDSLSLPPTPPSSTNSDSDGCDRSPPCSPHRSSRHHRPASPIIQQPFFMSPIPTSGVLVLSEEEKRTLISEGYPIPGKLPLTKQEEKNLKKIRRKIKNKISAQESRRKKKEYLETLERKVEAFSQENVDLRKKVDNLQNNNQSLASQLQKLQNIVRGISPTTTHSAGTCLMVLVLCFAVMLGSWSPMSLSMGYSSSLNKPAAISALSTAASSSSPSSSSSYPPSQYYPSPDMLAAAVGGGGGLGSGVTEEGGRGYQGLLQASTVHQGLGAGQQQQQQEEAQPSAGPAAYGPYATPNMRSRVLMSVEEEDEEFGPHAPFSYKWLLGGIFGGCSASEEHAAATVQSYQPTLPKVNVMDVETEINQTGAPSRQPDIAVTTSSKPINATA